MTDAAGSTDVAQTCLGDEQLAGLLEGTLGREARRALTLHLDACSDCRQLVAVLLRDPEASRSYDPHAGLPGRQDEPFDPGDRYRLGRLLGAGGMGLVHEAFDQVRDERVALKRLPRLTPAGVSRFKDEFRALADMRHPHVVRFHELVADGERCFFSMERIAGRPLDDALSPLPSYDGPRLRRLFAQLAEALVTLHAHGLVHRDIKPANVLVTAEDRVVLVDFGLAVDMRPGGAPPRRAGTLAYMAPEQLSGTTLGSAADWFGFGGCLYRCLTGLPPFVGDRRRPRRAEHPDAALVDLCTRLLHAEPARRPSADEVLRGLGASPPAVAPSAHFIGREAELATLGTALTERTPTLVSGPPGIGKTALVRRAVELRAAQGALVFASRCRFHEHVPFNAVDGIIEGLAGHLRDNRASAPPPASLGAVATLFPALSAFAPRRHGLGAEQAARWIRERAASELAAVFRTLAGSREVILVVDDLQWADAESSALLGQLLEQQPRSFSLLATARSGADAVPLPPALVGIETHVLGPLLRDDARALVGATVPRADALIDAAAGHPLWLRRFVLAGANASDATFEGLVGAQLDALSALPRRALDLLTLAHVPLALAQLGRALELPESQVWQLVDRLVQAELVRLEPPAEAPRVEPYHDRIRELACQLALGDRRAEHLCLARALRGGEAATQTVFARADHANGALGCSLSSAEARQLAEMNYDAARHAAAATTHAVAAHYAASGLTWLNQHAAHARGSDELVTKLRLVEIEAHWLSGDRDQAERAFASALRATPAARHAVFLRQRVRLALLVDGVARAREVGLEALAAVGAPIRTPVRLRELAVLALRAEVGMRTRWPRVARDRPSASREAAQRMALYVDLAPVAVFDGDFGLTGVLALRCLESTLGSGLAPASVLGIAGYGGWAAQTGRYGETKRAHGLAVALMEQMDDVPAIAQTAVGGWLAPWAEPYAVTERRFAELEAGLAARGEIYGLSMMRTIRMTAGLEAGLPLNELEALPRSVLQQITRANLQFEELLGFSRLAVATLRRMQDDPELPNGAAHHNPFATFITHLHETKVRCHWGQVDQAGAALGLAWRSRWAARAQPLLARMYVYVPLVACQLAEASGVRFGQSSRYLAALESVLELGRMAQVCPENHGYRHSLAQAELLRWTSGSPALALPGYERTIDAALRAGNLEYEALARVRRLEALRRSGRPVDSQEVERMRAAYASWGCALLGAQLAARFG